MIAAKFLRWYQEVLGNIESNEEDWDMSQRISFQHAGSILTTMGFLQETVTEEKADYKLFQELWALMEGEARDGVSKDDLAYILMLILGVRDPAREVECPADPEKHGLARFIIFD